MDGRQACAGVKNAQRYRHQAAKSLEEARGWRHLLCRQWIMQNCRLEQSAGTCHAVSVAVKRAARAVVRWVPCAVSSGSEQKSEL